MRSNRYPEYNTPIMIGKRVAIVGGGNVAMDAARTAVRLGAEHVYIVYRRSRKEMPARNEEIENAEKEGVELVLLNNPVKIIGDSNDRVCGMECIRMELGEPDDSGRRRPVPIEGSEYRMDVDVVVMAIVTGPNKVLLDTLPDLKVNKRGYIEVDDTGLTNIPNVYAGGDIVTGSATVISAMGAARNAGQAMREQFEN